MTSPARNIAECIKTSRLATKLSASAGAVAGVVGPNSVEIVSLGAGVDATTPMEIGSLTKVFTVLLVAEAVRRDELELSSGIDEVLFGESWQGASAITIEQLATHTSGLPRLGLSLWKLLTADPYCSTSRNDLMGYLQRKRPRSMGTHGYRYSNLGYAVLGLMTEKAASRPYSELLQERLFRPLGLSNTAIQAVGGPDLATPGYRANGKQASSWHWDAYAPCGGLVSTFDDLVLCVRAFLNTSHPIAGALELTTRPRRAQKGDGKIGLGWMLPAAGESFWHNGCTGGYASYLGVDAGQGRGVIVLANQAFTMAMEVTELGHELMRMVRSETAHVASG